MTEYLAEIKELPQSWVLASRQKTSINGVGFVARNLLKQAANAGLTVTGPVMVRYFDENYNPYETDFEVCIPVSSNGPGVLVMPRTKVIYTTHVGDFAGVAKAWEALEGECIKRGYNRIGPPVEVYVRGPESTMKPSEWITELRFPIE